MSLKKDKKDFASWLLLCVTFWASTSLHADEHFSPMANWKTKQSTSFRVNYLPEYQQLAERTIQLAETILPTLSDYFDWQPKGQIEITINPLQDTANGYASPLPYNRIVIYTAQPDLHTELSDHGDWLELLLRHELVHIVHLDKADDLPLNLRSIFGRNLFLFPNLFQSNFYKEGLATYLETSWQQETGRGQSAYYDMVLRSEVYSGLLPLSKVQQKNRDWPLNQSYSYGVAFYQFLDEQYGNQQAAALVRNSSEQLIPLRLNRPLANTTDFNSIESTWEAFEIWLAKRYALQISALEKAEKPATLPLSDSGYLNDSPYADEQGNVYYSAFHPYRPSELVQIDRAGNRKALIRLYGKTRIIGRTSDQLWYLQNKHCDHRSTSFDLYRLDLLSGASERLTTCQHYVDGDIRRDRLGETLILMLKEHGGQNHIVTLDAQNLVETHLRSGSITENFASPRWLEPGKTLVYAHKNTQQDWVIRQFEVGSQQAQTVLAQPGTNFYSVQPSMSGRHLFIETDKDNLVEIWRTNLDGSELVQVTRSLGGAIQPSIDEANQRLVFRGYDHRGWNIYSQAIAPVSPASIPVPGKPGTGVEPSIEQSTATSRNSSHTDVDYSPLETVWPTSWFFNFSSDRAHTTANLLLSGQDSLQFHRWYLAIGRDFENDLPVGQLNYTLYNHLNLSYERYYDYQIGDSGAPAGFVDKAVTEEEHSNYSALYFHTQPLDGAEATLFGGVNANEERYQDVVAGRYFRDRKVETLGLGLQYNSAIRTWLSLGPTHGRSVKLTLERDRVSALNPVVPNSSTNPEYGTVATVDWKEYVHLYQAHRLELRFFAGHAQRDADPFDLSGSSLRSVFTDHLIHLRDYSLRGYPDDSPELFGRDPRILSADYEFPLLRPDQGIAGWPLGMSDLSATLFYESGETSNRYERYDAAGLELHLDLDLAYSLLPLTITGGIAQPFQDTLANRQKDANFYLGFGLGF